METNLRIFQMDGSVWYIGHSLESCIADYKEMTGIDDDLLEDAREFPESDLDLHWMLACDAEGSEECDADGKPTGRKITLREQMAADVAQGGKFPRMYRPSNTF